MIPELILGEHLHEPDTPFDQPSSNQTTFAELACCFLVDTVHPMRCGRFLAEIGHFISGNLHSLSEFEIGDPSLKFMLTLTLLQMTPV